jgi:prepilin-type N-terminal cleavage/methylation domain-containing protein
MLGRGPTCRIRSGFTLVELLVVIVIIAALAGVAVVISRKATDRANVAKAVSALRQVAVAGAGYAAENQNRINTVREPGDPREGREGPVIDSFWGRMGPYLFSGVGLSQNPEELRQDFLLRLDPLFNSKDARTMEKTFMAGAPVFQDGSGLPVPVAFNRNVYQSPGGEIRDARMTQFRDPGNTVYAVFGYFLFDRQDAQRAVELPQGSGAPNVNLYYFNDGSAAFSFLDGRVEVMRPPLTDRRFGLLPEQVSR